ncbi:hypothetical protein MKW92_050415, partial [Papaver armeniacum]
NHQQKTTDVATMHLSTYVKDWSPIRRKENNAMRRYFWAQQKRSYSGSRTNSWRF